MSQRFFVFLLVVNFTISYMLGASIEHNLQGMILFELWVMFLLWIEDRKFKKP